MLATSAWWQHPKPGSLRTVRDLENLKINSYTIYMQVFWYVTPCRWVSSNRRFERLVLLSPGVKQAKFLMDSDTKVTNAFAENL